jgi:hypothetical protein
MHYIQLIYSGKKALGERERIQCIKQICLSCTIVAYESIQFGGKVDHCLPDILEINNGKCPQIHFGHNMAQNYSKIGDSARIINNVLLIIIRNYADRNLQCSEKKSIFAARF